MVYIEIRPGARDPDGYCSLCDELLYGSLEEMQKHMATCARRHIDDIRELAPSAQFRGTVFDPSTWNEELEAHMGRVGERMLKEGRLEMLPSERVENE